MRFAWVLGIVLGVTAVASCDTRCEDEDCESLDGGGSGGLRACKGETTELDANGCPIDFLAAQGSCCDQLKWCTQPDPSGCYMGFIASCTSGVWSYAIHECGRRCCDRPRDEEGGAGGSAEAAGAGGALQSAGAGGAEPEAGAGGVTAADAGAGGATGGVSGGGAKGDLSGGVGGVAGAGGA